MMKTIVRASCLLALLATVGTEAASPPGVTDAVSFVQALVGKTWLESRTGLRWECTPPRNSLPGQVTEIAICHITQAGTAPRHTVFFNQMNGYAIGPNQITLCDDPYYPNPFPAGGSFQGCLTATFDRARGELSVRNGLPGSVNSSGRPTVALFTTATVFTFIPGDVAASPGPSIRHDLTLQPGSTQVASSHVAATNSVSTQRLTPVQAASTARPPPPLPPSITADAIARETARASSGAQFHVKEGE